MGIEIFLTILGFLKGSDIWAFVRVFIWAFVFIVMLFCCSMYLVEDQQDTTADYEMMMYGEVIEPIRQGDIDEKNH